MCIIVDANRLGTFLADPVTPDAAPIRRWLDRGSGQIVYSTGGTYSREVGGRQRTKLLRYVQNGQARQIPAEQFSDDERTLSGHRPSFRRPACPCAGEGDRSSSPLYRGSWSHRGLQGQEVHRSAEGQSLFQRGECPTPHKDRLFAPPLTRSQTSTRERSPSHPIPQLRRRARSRRPRRHPAGPRSPCLRGRTRRARRSRSRPASGIQEQQEDLVRAGRHRQ